jgi:hypothetical protein
MKNQNQLKLLFKRLKIENAPFGIGYFPNGKSFVGRIVVDAENYMTLIAEKGKKVKILSFKKFKNT